MFKTIRTLILPVIAIIMASYAIFQLIMADENLPELPPPSIPSHTLSFNRLSGTGVIEPVSETVSIGNAQDGVVMEVFYNSQKVGTRLASSVESA
jgi:hypothetical protein